MAAEALLLPYIEHCVTSVAPDPTALSADCLGGEERTENSACLGAFPGGDRVLRGDCDSQRQPEPVRQHGRPGEVREAASSADRL